ncbi:Chaperone protein dnaJ [Umbelopsis sp. WA50703]
MEVNKEEAVRCLSIAKNHFGNGNYTSAVKLAKKSISLYPTDEAKAFLVKAEARAQNAGSSATATGSSANASSSAESTKRREHKAQAREYTQEQIEAVKRIRACGTDYYKVLSLEKTCTETEIKKSYRKLALQFHPDKNGAPGADEAFKMISKAFTVLSDSQKRAVFDAGGGDPEQRGGGGGASMFNQFHQQRYASSYGGDELSPEDLFNAFFGGGGFDGPGFGPGFRSATFVGPGFRTRTFNTGGARRGQGQRQQPTSTWMTLAQLLPLLLLFGVSILSSLFSDNTPQFSFDRTSLYSQARSTRQHRVDYYVNPSAFSSYEKNARKLREFEQNVELNWIRGLQAGCQNEKQTRSARINQARGGLFGFGHDEERYQQALKMPMKSCEQLRSFGYNPDYY